MQYVYTFREAKESEEIRLAINNAFENRFKFTIEKAGQTFTLRLKHPITQEEKQQLRSLLQTLDKTDEDWRQEWRAARQKYHETKDPEVVFNVLGQRDFGESPQAATIQTLSKPSLFGKLKALLGSR